MGQSTFSSPFKASSVGREPSDAFRRVSQDDIGPRNTFRIATSTSLLVSAITVCTTFRIHTITNPHFRVLNTDSILCHGDYLLNNLTGSAKYLAEFRECRLYLPDRFPAVILRKQYTRQMRSGDKASTRVADSDSRNWLASFPGS